MSTDWNKVQREHYDGFVEAYDEDGERRDRGYERKARLLARALAGVRGTVLEVGAGTGLVSARLATQIEAATYIALDLSPPMLAAAERRATDPRMRFQLGDAMATGLPDGSCDAVIGIDVLHHLGRPVDALRDWYRVTQPGGRLVLLEANAYNLANRSLLGQEFELRVFLNTPENLRAWATEAGWRDVTVRPTPTYTPSGPPALGPVLDLLDRAAARVPQLGRMTALWCVEAKK